MWLNTERASQLDRHRPLQQPFRELAQKAPGLAIASPVGAPASG